MDSDILINLLINFVITCFLYLIIPILLKFVWHKKYDKIQARKIAIINSAIVFIIFCAIHIIIGDSQLANPLPMFFYGYIAYYILLNKNKSTATYDKNEDCEVENLISQLSNENK